MCGIVLSGFVPLGMAVPIVGAGFVLLAVEFYRRPLESDRRWILTFLCFAMVFTSYFRAALVSWEYERKVTRSQHLMVVGHTQIQGRLLSAFSQTGKGWKALLDHTQVYLSGAPRSLPARVEVWIRGEERPTGEAGDLLKARGRWRQSPLQPLAGEFDPRLWNLSRDVVGTFQVWGSSEYKIEAASAPTPYERLIRLRDRWRTTITAWFEEHLPRDASALVLAMTTGQRSDLSAEVRSDLVRAGLFHLTAVSGLHVTAMLAAFPWFLKPLGVRRKWRCLLGIPLALLLLLVVGGRPSVVRAVVLGICLMVGFFLDRTVQTLNLLGAAALILLVYDPALLASPAFQLSFFIVAALSIWGWSGSEGSAGRRFEFFLIRTISPTHTLGWFVGRSLLWFATALWTSAIAVLAAAPLTAYHFQQVSMGGLIGNLLGIPLAIVTTVVGMVSLLLLPVFPRVSEWIAQPLSWLAGLLLDWADWVASFSFASFPIARPSPFGLALLVSALLSITFRTASPMKTRRIRRVAALALLALFVWWPILGVEREMRLTFLNVGQGDACLLEFPTGQTLLIDAGSGQSERAGNYSPLTSALLERGIERLDAALLSHPEEDHYGGLAQLVREMPVGAVLCSGDTNPSEEFSQLVGSIRSASVELIRVLAGDRIEGFGDNRLLVLNPTSEEIEHQIGDRNERSVVLLLESMGLRALFPGDIGEETELEIAEILKDGNVHILKVGHHGSRYSSSETFLSSLKPVLAVVSCGENNFGHPHPEAMSRLLAAGVEVYSTRHHGSVEFCWDGTILRRRFPN
jgi:competence protein ComEC